MEEEMEKAQKETPNFESVWAILRETAQLQKENEMHKQRHCHYKAGRRYGGNQR